MNSANELAIGVFITIIVLGLLQAIVGYAMNCMFDDDNDNDNGDGDENT